MQAVERVIMDVLGEGNEPCQRQPKPLDPPGLIADNCGGAWLKNSGLHYHDLDAPEYREKIQTAVLIACSYER